jgi:putative SOS response-associated peptidase YedK
MCGRYASSRNADSLIEQFEIDVNDLDQDAAEPNNAATGAAQDGAQAPEPAGVRVKAVGYNIAPTDTVPIVLERLVAPDREPEAGAAAKSGGSASPVSSSSIPSKSREPAQDDDEAGRVVRRLRPLTWGLVPSWSKERTGGARMINARAESLLEKPAYRKAAVARRCLVPADGWYEWQASPTETDAKGKPRKQPFFMSLAEGGGLAMAGIYEFWRDREKDGDDPLAWLVTFAIITTEAEPGLDVIHNRMPLVLPADRWANWLDPQLNDPDAVRALLERPEPGRFATLPISTRVNSVRNDGPELLQPAPEDQLVGVLDPATGELIGGGAPLF